MENDQKDLQDFSDRLDALVDEYFSTLPKGVHVGIAGLDSEFYYKTKGVKGKYFAFLKAVNLSETGSDT